MSDQEHGGVRPAPKLLLSAASVARSIGATEREVNVLIVRGVLPSVGLPGSVQRRVPFALLRAWLEELVQREVVTHINHNSM